MDGATALRVLRPAADLFPRTVCFDGLSPDVTVTVLENPSGSWAAGNGATVWDCAIALAGYLLKHRCCSCCCSSSPCRGVELGAGVGLVSLALAQGAGARMVATERPLMLDLLQENCRYNSGRRQHDSLYFVHTHSGAGGGVGVGGVGVGGGVNDGPTPCSSSSAAGDLQPHEAPPPPGDDKGEVEVMPLVWGSSDDLGHVLAVSPRGVDFVVAADVVFASNSDSWGALADTLAALLRQDGGSNSGSYSCSCSRNCTDGTGGTSGVRCWLTYEPRDSTVFAAFFDGVLREHGIHYTRLVDRAVVPDDIYLLELALA